MVRGKKMKNPLRKRLPRELKTEFGKYLVIFLLLVATIGLVSGFLVADGSMIIAYNEGFEKYNVEKIGFPERWMMLTQSDSELAELDEVSPEIFKKQRILISERPEVRQFIADWAGFQVSDLEIIGGFNLGFHLFEIARAGIGEAVVTEGAYSRLP